MTIDLEKSSSINNLVEEFRATKYDCTDDDIWVIAQKTLTIL